MTDIHGKTVLTVGHSNHHFEQFKYLLSNNNVQILVDIRSKPSSRWPQYRQAKLRTLLGNEEIEYIHIGQLGGHPADPSMYIDGKHVNYERLAASGQFRAGLRNLLQLIDSEDRCIVLMCAEGDPAKCHRDTLIVPVLLESGLRINQIMPDGTIASPGHSASNPYGEQLPLVEPTGEDSTWISPKPIPKSKRALE